MKKYPPYTQCAYCGDYFWPQGLVKHKIKCKSIHSKPLSCEELRERTFTKVK